MGSTGIAMPVTRYATPTTAMIGRSTASTDLVGVLRSGTCRRAVISRFPSTFSPTTGSRTGPRRDVKSAEAESFLLREIRQRALGIEESADPALEQPIRGQPQRGVAQPRLEPARAEQG